MLFDFECDKCGKGESHDFPIGRAPGLGKKHPDRRCSCGASLTRVVSLPRSNPEYQRARDKYPYVTRRYAHLDGADQRDAAGHPVILSQQHEREVMARNGLTRD